MRLMDIRQNLRWIKSYGVEEYAKKFRSRYPHKTEKQLKKEYDTRIKYWERSIEKLEKLISNPDVYLSAKFLRSFKSDDPTNPNDVTIILLDGNIKGDFWDEYEYYGAPIPKWVPGDLSDMAYHALAAAVVKQAAADRDKPFFMKGGDFELFMPGYDGEAVWEKIKENEKEHGRWYAEKKAEKEMESCDIF